MSVTWANGDGALVFLLLLALERGLEIVVARQNEIWLRSRGGQEYAARFSRFIVGFHTLWFLAFATEATLRPAILHVPLWAFGLAVLGFQAGRYWCITTLGRFWNTKILVLPGARLVRKGPYRLFKHPNYLVVIIEIVLYPALFGCWLTAAFFGTANFFILRRRIAQEEQALAAHTDFRR